MKKTLPFMVILFLTGCATVPITGRRQLSFIPQAELLALSDQQYKQVLSQSKISADPDWNAKVKEVGQRIAGAAEVFMKENGMEREIANYRWEFSLIDNPKSINAFCMPGGKIVVYTGMLPVAQDEVGLAVVISHEVAHVLANHGGERLSQELIVQAGGMGFSQLIKSKPETAKQIMLQVYGAGTQLGVLMPYGRAQESEADRIGLILMARAGYDPNTAIPFWRRMNGLGGGARPPEFLSTHPTYSRRIAEITEVLPEAEKYYSR